MIFLLGEASRKMGGPICLLALINIVLQFLHVFSEMLQF